MEKEHKKIELYGGNTLEDVVKDLMSYKEKGELVYVEFNGTKLYSDVDNMDSCYKKVTGKTKAEYDEAERIRQEEYEEEKRKHEEAIPEKTKEWIEKGNAIIDKEYQELWAQCVPIRLGDLYRGMELGCCLDIVKPLNEGCTLDEAKEIIEGQGHSGMSHDLVCSMVKSFCKRGAGFVEYIR